MSQMLRRQQHCFQIPFIQGMSLQHYMAGLVFNSRLGNSCSLQNQQQDLYQSTIDPSLKPKLVQKKQPLGKKSNQKNPIFFRQLLKDEINKIGVSQQLTKTTLKEQNQPQAPSPLIRNQSAKNSTSYSISGPSSVNKFRIKHFSNSPVKKSKQQKAQDCQSNLKTIKSSKQIELEPNGLNQVGQFKEEVNLMQESLLNPIQIKKLASKVAISKKNCSNVPELNEAENRVRRKTSTKFVLPDLAIQGLSSKIALQRTNS